MNKLFYIDLPEGKTQIAQFLFWTLVAYVLFTWFSIHSHASITADTLWLCDAATRLLSGEKMSAAYYDPNPPLSVLLYVPPALAAMTGWIGMHQAVFMYVLLLLAGATALTYRFLKAIPDLDHTTVVAATVAFVVANTIMPSINFTERDQVLGMWLVPFVLAQLCITKKWPLPPVLKHMALCVGAIMILIKPHHGLLPTLIILHRAITQKRLDVWRDTDFLYLAAAVLGYAAVLFTFFSDYLHVIMPDVLSLYLHQYSKFAVLKGAFYGLLCIAAILIAVVLNNKSWLFYFFLTAALVSLIPYIVQMKGYHYHLLPAVVFFWCGVAVLAKQTLEKFMTPQLALIAVTLFMTALSFVLTPTRILFPTMEKYKELPLAEFLSSCENPCPVFVLNDHIEITHQTALYSHKPWASRFPSFWFIPGIFDPDKTSADEIEYYRAKYGRMVGEDLAYYKPKLVLIGTFKLKDESDFDFIDFFGPEETFRKEWAHYRQKEDFNMDQKVYFTGTNLARKPHPMTYKVFERKAE